MNDSSVKTLNGDVKQLFVNQDYYLELYFYSDCGDDRNVSFHFDRLNSENLVPIRFQYAKARDMAEARSWAEKFLAGWSKQHAELGCTGVVDLS